MRLGIFGGSFDPPHVGHLLMAQDAVTALSLDRLLIVPAAQQPLKQQQASANDRLAMTRRSFGGIAAVEVDPIEIDRGGLSFMVDTVDAFRRRWPLAEFHLLIGADVVATLPRWRDPERLLGMARLVVLRRGPWDRAGKDAPADPPVDPDSPVGRAIHTAPRLETRTVEVSSTEVRARVQAGRSIRGFVPAAVEAYIASAGLYVRVPTADDVAARA
jgi:nicotinate-nucleotide adenylyltransferase